MAVMARVMALDGGGDLPKWALRAIRDLGGDHPGWGG